MASATIDDVLRKLAPLLPDEVRRWKRQLPHLDATGRRLLEVFHGEARQLTIERLLGKCGHKINYRHVVRSLLCKPGAFRRYRYRDDLFPTEVFRTAFDLLDAKLPEREADIEYLRVLHLAATTMEADVDASLRRLLARGCLPLAQSVREEVAPRPTNPPELEAVSVDLSCYDELLVEQCLEVLSA